MAELGPVQYPERWCRWCLLAGVEHINQSGRCVHKHQHFDDVRCTRPWTALCQTEHGRLCHISEHPSQPEATAALDAHLRAGVHIRSGDDDQPVQTGCAVVS